jgi:hypothetical protein
MPTKLKFGIFLGVLVHPTMHQRLVSAAESQGCTWSDVVRAALDKELPELSPHEAGTPAPIDG